MTWKEKKELENKKVVNSGRKVKFFMASRRRRTVRKNYFKKLKAVTQLVLVSVSIFEGFWPT